jgi:hypothetical protein
MPPYGGSRNDSFIYLPVEEFIDDFIAFTDQYWIRELAAIHLRNVGAHIWHIAEIDALVFSNSLMIIKTGEDISEAKIARESRNARIHSLTL